MEESPGTKSFPPHSVFQATANFLAREMVQKPHNLQESMVEQNDVLLLCFLVR